MEFIVNEEQNKIRVDKFLSEKLQMPRNQVQKLIDQEVVLINDQKIKNNYKLQTNDKIIVNEIKEEEITIEPQNIPLNIMYEDEYLLIVNKPSNMVVHPAVGNYSNTLVNALQYYSNSLSDIGGKFRPGIVHRIDKDTSGLLLIAKTNQAHNKLSEMIKEKQVDRKYKAIVHGKTLEKKAIINAPIGRNVNDRKKMSVTEKNSKEAQTEITVLDSNENYTLIKCKLFTGRTHQIRVHMKFINHPIVGDVQYGPKKTIDTKGQALHAYNLSFVHPFTKEKIDIYAPYPEEFINTLKKTGLKEV